MSGFEHYVPNADNVLLARAHQPCRLGRGQQQQSEPGAAIRTRSSNPNPEQQSGNTSLSATPVVKTTGPASLATPGVHLWFTGAAPAVHVPYLASRQTTMLRAWHP
ncbi:MAG: hypothetical protein NVS3B26_24180 [Mycobacteriales bacterium]